MKKIDKIARQDAHIRLKLFIKNEIIPNKAMPDGIEIGISYMA